jgi:hypothetical protein
MKFSTITRRSYRIAPTSFITLFVDFVLISVSIYYGFSVLKQVKSEFLTSGHKFNLFETIVSLRNFSPSVFLLL